MKARGLATVACKRCDPLTKWSPARAKVIILVAAKHDARRRQLVRTNCSFFIKTCPIRLMDGVFLIC
jgi:hypothetical protein